MAKNRKFNKISGINSFDELLLFILAATNNSMSTIAIENEFNELENKVTNSFIRSILKKFKSTLISYLIIEEKKKVISGYPNNNTQVSFRKKYTYSLVEDAKNIDIKDLLLLTGDHYKSSHDIFIEKYPHMQKYFVNAIFNTDYVKSEEEENIPPENAILPIIIYLLFYKGQMKISDIVNHITKLYGQDSHDEKTIRNCFNIMQNRIIYNLISSLDIKLTGDRVYYLKKQVFSDKVTFEELEELCDIKDSNDPCLTDFLNKYKNLRIYFTKKKTQVKLTKFNDLSHNHLIDENDIDENIKEYENDSDTDNDNDSDNTSNKSKNNDKNETNILIESSSNKPNEKNLCNNISSIIKNILLKEVDNDKITININISGDVIIHH